MVCVAYTCNGPVPPTSFTANKMQLTPPSRLLVTGLESRNVGYCSIAGILIFKVTL